MPKLRLIFLAAGALIVAGGGAAYVAGLVSGGDSEAVAAEAGAPSGPPPAVVRVAEAVRAELAPQAEVPGTVVSLRDSLVAAAAAGKIEWVAEIGAEVEEGAAIARIDPVDARLALAEAEADVGRLSARADNLAKLYERYLGLGAESGESEAFLDQMRADRDAARNDLVRAEAALARARVNLERTEVRAPFAGRVAAQAIQVGEYAAPGAALLRLVDTRRLEVTAQAPASVLAAVRPGDSIPVSDGVKTLQAEARAVVPVGDEVTRMLELRLALPADESGEAPWPIGAAVRARLPTRTPQPVVAAHRDALILRAGRVSVFVVDAENTARRVDVELGTADGELIEVIGEIAPGDRLVIRGGERLRDGQPVSVQAPLSAAADAPASNLF
ncbi:efflux RND transporter periplasmic adaptor subunit [Amphiplicatus metriothermophilus]|uniref:RND family efflux transporter, MFP subunit n=1 Tax=Amphiplicatus metriothermophilus TaxID=1519374 RepID=A0A239PJ79_9PROT|nr:efflux RND transporter periplasmic adaptor subunit [Amphiplicatus metriothermophilus]MBB5518046.1 RND family efflux transporter MFP subunit [Amphiplicatus metriothermophilus]SNT67620.1 RND family efflux transporter, MFP subunit [Amphiplicatus metriothermophilus]